MENTLNLAAETNETETLADAIGGNLPAGETLEGYAEWLEAVEAKRNAEAEADREFCEWMESNYPLRPARG